MNTAAFKPHAANRRRESSAQTGPQASSFELAIEGMNCASCVGRVEAALAQVPGVQAASVNLTTGKAQVQADADLSRQMLKAAVEKAGYKMSSQTTQLSVTGMTCASCVGRVEAAIRQIPGVDAVSANFANGQVQVQSSRPIDRKTLAHAIRQAGYALAPENVELSIRGMSCASCVGRVERALQAIEGVEQVSVNLATERASLQTHVPPATLIAAVQQAGYEASEIAQTGSQASSLSARQDAQAAALKRDLMLATALALPVFILEMGAHLIPGMHSLIANTIGMQANWLIQFALTAGVLIFPGRRFYQVGIPALLRLAPDMNSLVAVGTAAAFAYSVVATFAPGLLPAGTVNVYYEAAAVIVALILLGRYLEARAKGRTSEAIQRLVGLQPQIAHVQREGQFVDVPIGEVVLGDVIELRPGERVPVDAEVIEGNSYIDESMITGEPMAVAKSTGDTVVGGTVNQAGALRLRATAVGEHTMLAQIIRLVEQAQASKLPIQAAVDKVTLWFVPAVIAAALLTFIVWMIFGPAPALSLALVNAVAVLIIACPCAMGLATPTSIMVGTGRGAEMGVLFRKGEALQALKNARLVAFDKTGTLTEGQPTLTDLQTAHGFDRQQVLTQMAAVEARSEHPIAQAIVQAAKDQGLQLPQATQFASVTGMGVRAQVRQARVEVGADRFMRELGLDVAPFADTAQRLASEGKSPMYAAIDGRLAAIIAVADPIKASTPVAINALHQLGLKVAMITGDNAHTAQAIARQLGIDDVVAEVLPEGKVQAIQRLKAAHGPIAFVGDGINDAPALAEADIGLAIGTGTEVAVESAQVVLMSGNLQGVGHAIALSRATIGNIHQNLFWAFAYNTALIPVAAGILYPAWGILLSPIFAAAAMAMSSVFVLGNALRLKRFKPQAASLAA